MAGHLRDGRCSRVPARALRVKALRWYVAGLLTPTLLFVGLAILGEEIAAKRGWE